MEVRSAKKPTTLADVGDAPTHVEIDGKDYELHKLTMDDFCSAETHLREQSLKTFLTATRMTPMGEEARGDALARIATKQFSIFELLDTPAARFYLLFLSLKRGDPSLSFAWLKQHMPHETIAVLSEIMYSITGLTQPKSSNGNGAADPTTTSPTTSAEANTGETNS